MVYERKYKYVSCFAEYQGLYILVSSTTNQMYILEKETQNVLETICFNREQSERKNLFSQCVLCENRLILIPETAKSLIMCELETKKIVYLDIPENFLKMVKVSSEEYFLMGCKTGNLYKFDIINQRMRFIDRFESGNIATECLTPLSDLIFMNGIYVKNKIIFPLRRYPQIYVFDTKKNEGIVKIITTDRTGFVDLVYEGGRYYLLSESGDIYVIDEEFRGIRKIQVYLDNQKTIRYPFRYINVDHKQIVLLPMYSRKIVKIDIKNSRVKEFDVSKEFFGTGRYNTEKIKNGFVVFESENTKGCQVDIEHERILPFLNLEDKENALNYFIKRKYSVEESQSFFEIGKKIWRTLEDGMEFNNRNV